MLWLNEVFFNKNVIVAEGLAGLAADKLKGLLDLLRRVAAAHPTSAAAPGRFQNDRETVQRGLFHRVLCVFEGFGTAGNGGNPAGDGEFFGRKLVTHHCKYRRGRSNEYDAVLLTGSGKFGILRQKPVAGMNGRDSAAPS
ncbi:hypothetical protein SDC9_84886 [bioreactor metagenome]|uniref:Uncharacterized protein n=1 Tax=bioreactor metagenome TaxID=1076179 RepID=A0A644ZC49_9ZZZZ